MGFRQSHIGINFTSKRIYIYYRSNIQVEFHLMQNLNPIGIKISNQFVCFYLIIPIKSGIHMNRKKLFFYYFFMEKIKLFFYNQKKKKKTNVFIFRKINVYYIQILFFGEKREGVYFKLKYLLPYLLCFFFILLYPKAFFVNWYE